MNIELIENKGCGNKTEDTMNIEKIQKKTIWKYEPTMRPIPPKILIYGSNGIGKSHFAAAAPNPVFVDLDRNINEILCVSNDKDLDFPIEDFNDLMRFLAALLNNDHDFKTLVIDSISRIEGLIEEQVFTEAGVTSMADLNKIDYGKSSKRVIPLWDQFYKKIENLWNKKKMIIILIGHHQMKEVKKTTGLNYHRFEPKLTEDSSSLLQNWVSTMLFIDDNPDIKEESIGFGRTLKKATKSTANRRIIFTNDRTRCLAKNTYNLPLFMNYESGEQGWNDFYEGIKDFYRNNKGIKERSND